MQSGYSIIDKLSNLEGSRDEIIRSGLLKDVENILNTNLFSKIIYPYKDLRTSIINYGVIDFTTLVINGKEDIDNLLDYIKEVIHLWEPRLINVSIEAASQDDDISPILVIRISAQTNIEGHFSQITFDASLDTLSGSVVTNGKLT